MAGINHLGFRSREVLRIRVARNRQAGRYPGHEVRLRQDARGGAQGCRGHRRTGRDQVAGPDRRPDEGRRGQVRRHPRAGRARRSRRPEPRDQRPHAARRARRPQGRGQAGALRRCGLGRDPQAPGDALQRHGRHRHRRGQRAAPRPCGARPPLERDGGTGLRRQGGRRPDRGDRQPPQPHHPHPRPACAAVQRLRHDAGRDQPARRARGRHLRRPRRPHGHGERGPPAPEEAARRSSGSETRRPARPARRQSSSCAERRSTPWTTAAWRAT